MQRREFRLLLVYLERYAELFLMFVMVDDSGDKRLDPVEFKDALPQLAVWGVEVEDAEAVFGAIDQNGGGFVLFDEFSDWALRDEGLKCLPREEGEDDEYVPPPKLKPAVKDAGRQQQPSERPAAAPPAPAKPVIILPKAGIQFLAEVTIEPVATRPNSPFQQYLEAQRRHAEAARAVQAK